MAYFRSDIDIIVFFLLGGMKMSGSAGLFNKKNKKITLSGAQGWAEREMGNTKKNTATLIYCNVFASHNMNFVLFKPNSMIYLLIVYMIGML